ncbi:MAG: hypothetical protein OZ948_04200 [Deltaproteobacteria bacterium]|nr:hypothetical protein [Deltaproteobacteria bacterium]
MPGLLAMAVASAAGWAVAAVVRPVAGGAGSLVGSFVLGAVVFVMAKRCFAELRGDR